MAQATAFQLHEAYLEQAWRTMKDSILLKMTYNTDGSKINETPDEFRQRTAQRSALEGKHGPKAQQRAQQEASLQQPSDPVARRIAGAVAPAPAVPTGVDVSGAQVISAPPTSTVGAPTGGAIGPGSGSSGIGPGSAPPPLPTHGPRVPTAPANGLVGVQQPGATNQNPEPGAGIPQQRTTEQKIKDLTATMQKPHTEDMSFGQRVSATAGQIAGNMQSGTDNSLQTGLGLRIMPRNRYIVPPTPFPYASPM